MDKPHNHGSSVNPEELHELQEYILNSKGKYGMQRLERAADEIPDLFHHYSPKALRRVFTGDNASAVATINPADFEKYASAIRPQDASQRIYWGDRPEPRYEDLLKHAKLTSKQYSSMSPDVQSHILNQYKNTLPEKEMNHEEYIKHLANTKQFRDVPWWQLNKEHVRTPEIPNIEGHEGRHRNRALASKGVKKALVHVMPTGTLREWLPRGSQEEYLDAMRHELSLTGNLVQPEHRPFVKDEGERRSPILLPDMYAKGGDVEHMKHELREKNKAKYLKNSKEKGVFYHGTAHNFDSGDWDPSYEGITKFDPAKHSRRGATFVSPNKEFANFYAKEYPAAKSAGKLSGTMYPLHVQAKNPWDYENPGHVQAVLDILNEGKDGGYTPHYLAPKGKATAQNWEAVEHPDTQKAIKKLGHDSFYVHELGIKNLGLYHPHQLKSAIGNRGTYDPNDPDITKADGGDVRSNFKKQIDQMRAESEMRQKLQNQYTKEHAHLVHDQWPTMQEWLNKRQGN